MPRPEQPHPDKPGPTRSSPNPAPQKADEATLALGHARAAGAYLRGVVEECELVRRMPSFGDPGQLRIRAQIALDAVEYRTDLLAEQGQAPAADEIRLAARHTVNDLVVRDWAEHARPDLLQRWQSHDTDRQQAMTALRFAYAAHPDTQPTGRVALRGSAAELMRAYLDAQFDEAPGHGHAKPNPGQNMLPEFETRTGSKLRSEEIDQLLEARIDYDDEKGAPRPARETTQGVPDPTRESLERTRNALRRLPTDDYRYLSNAELEQVGVTPLEYMQLTTIDRLLAKGRDLDRLLDDGRDIGIPGVPIEDYLNLEDYDALDAEIDRDT